jgi:Tfp pilus assembly protein PilO
MKSKQLFIVLTTLTVLLGLGIVGAGVGANTMLTAKSNTLSKLKAKEQAMDEIQAGLNRSKSDLKRYAELNEIAKSIVPQDKDQTQTVREIVKIAQDSGISHLTSVTFPSSTLGAAGSSTLTQLTPVSGMAGVYTLPITVSASEDSAVTYNQLIAFLAGLEQNRRTAQVASLTLTPSDKTSSISFTLVINEYIKP